MAHDDQDLRERFAVLRREDADLAPDFAMLQKRRLPAPRPWRLRAAVAAALVVMVAVMALKFYQRPAPPPGPSITQWKSPTDFLLQTPGRELLESAPAFTSSEGMALPTAKPTPFGKKKS